MMLENVGEEQPSRLLSHSRKMSFMRVQNVAGIGEPKGHHQEFI
jgi:hypothetical protein